MFNDLKPNRTYWYKLNGEKTEFETPDVSNNVSIAISTDTHFGSWQRNNTGTIAVLENMKNGDFDYIFALGDLTNLGFLDSEWSTFINTFSPYTSEIPIRTILGNHDVFFGGKAHYKEYMYPDEMPIGNGSRTWYRIDIGDFHVIFLELLWGMETFSEVQETWLIEQLESIDENDLTIIMCHSLFYSSTNKNFGSIVVADQSDNIEGLVPIFEDNGVDMVFSGHSHTMEVLEINGVVYNIVSTFGSTRFDKNNSPSDYSIWKAEKKIGYAGLVINDTAAEVTFYDAENTVLFGYEYII
jgi:predicted MPP superfamily phosphohydrolase